MIDPAAYNIQITSLAKTEGFEVSVETEIDGFQILSLHRPSSDSGESPSLYLSAGIHGDEPAGPLAILRLLEEKRFPKNLNLTLCPLINPNGIRATRRENLNDQDLNRDFRAASQVETQAVAKVIDRHSPYALSICLHEDWESNGFYLYALEQAPFQNLSALVIEEVSKTGPIDLSPEIDGHPARGGLIERPEPLDIQESLDWPEAFYLIAKSPHTHYTFESPSSRPLDERISMLCTATQTAVEQVANSDSAKN